ncbi:PRD domain-containing protein [Sebaldella sp. S0638]|uniref:PRD domain-containing protein n=1 Tax=Sebaldella sp. S0638 TaxID=2957809 RepID=UPI00209F08F0|nr:PRD domain-containing protein [Sebaldella sp. S0638]MCP1226391.1 PRD domain-containing protein [Sebaldella sp. S0638]
MEQSFLEDVRQHLGLSEEEFSKYTDNAAEVEKILERNNVVFTYEFKLVFYSHIISFCQRLETNEKLNVTNSGFEEEISKDAYSISSEIIKMLSEKYETEADDLEIILAAIQIQLALEFQNQ